MGMNWDLLSTLWKDVDENGDGQLSADEVSLAVEKGVLTPRVVKTMDLDDDGAISEQEFEVARWKARLATASKFKTTLADLPEEQSAAIKITAAVKKARTINMFSKK